MLKSVMVAKHLSCILMMQNNLEEEYLKYKNRLIVISSDNLSKQKKIVRLSI